MLQQARCVNHVEILKCVKSTLENCLWRDLPDELVVYYVLNVYEIFQGSATLSRFRFRFRFVAFSSLGKKAPRKVSNFRLDDGGLWE